MEGKLRLVKQIILCFTFFTLIHVPEVGVARSAPEIHLYLDADISGAASSSLAIEQGIATALSEVGDHVAEHKVILIKKDHRGNSRRSLDNIKDYLADQQGLAVFAGLHSPPLLDNRKFINTQEVLTLVPWAAAGPITRYPSRQNWIFRLSVDDTKAGRILANFAVKQRKAKRPALLLEDTGWGKSNHKTVSRALNELGVAPVGKYWFNWGISEQSAGLLLKKISFSGADSIIFVANAPEAKTFILAMAKEAPQTRLPVYSHWGLTGGDFPDVVIPELRQGIDLFFLQTSFSFLRRTSDAFVLNVYEKAKKLYPATIREPEDIHAPNGFVHAYDLTRILIAAINQSGLTGDIKKDRQNVRRALEDLKQPVRGLLKTYQHPFSVFDELKNYDAHEALNETNLTMGRYGDSNEILLFEPDQPGSNAN